MIDGQNAERLLTPDMLLNDIRAEYKKELKSTGKALRSKIIIEIYFKDEDEYALQKGTEKLQNIDCPGIVFECRFDTQYGKEYQNRLEITDDEEAGC